MLSRLSSASGDFLGDTELVENLETTKSTAAEIEDKVLFLLTSTYPFILWSLFWSNQKKERNMVKYQ